MHNAAFRALGIDATYELWLTELDEIPARVASIREAGMLGANVTVPHKQHVMPHCDRLTETASRAGAVNTLIPTDEGLLGENTDVYGFAQSVRETIGDAIPERAVLLGAGGAARGVIVALQELGVAEITIANRTVAKAAEIATALSLPDRAPIMGIALADVSDVLDGVGLLVNSTSVGWEGDELPVSLEAIAALPDGALVMDLTYRETSFLRVARARGLPTRDGAGMLLHQGARAFELWTGQDAPVEIMRAAMFAD